MRLKLSSLGFLATISFILFVSCIEEQSGIQIDDTIDFSSFTDSVLISQIHSIQGESNDSVIASMAFELGKRYMEYSKYDSSRYYFFEAKFYDSTNHYLKGFAEIAETYYQQGNAEQALETIDQVIALVDTTSNEYLLLQSRRAAFLNALSKYWEAVTHVTEHIPLAMHRKDSFALFELRRIRNRAFFWLKSFNNAQNESKGLLELALALKDSARIIDVYRSLGNIALARKEYDQAQSYFQTQHRYHESGRDQFAVGVSLHNLGDVKYYLNEMDSALYYYHAALKIEKVIGDKEGIATTMGNIGIVFSETGRLDTGLYLMKEAAQLAFDRKDFLLAHSLHEDLSNKYDSIINDKDSSVHYLRLANIDRDSLEKANQQEDFAKVEVNYQTFLVQKENERLQRELRQTRRQRILIWSITLILLLGVTFILVYRSRKHKHGTSIVSKTHKVERVLIKGEVIQVDQVLYANKASKDDPNANKNDLHIHCRERVITISNMTLMKLLEELADDRFALVHKSYLVNLEAVNNYDQSVLRIGQKAFTMGKERRAEILEKLDGIIRP